VRCTTVSELPELPHERNNYHQQYLAKNPAGYCGISGTGVSCPVGFTEAVEQAGFAASEG